MARNVGELFVVGQTFLDVFLSEAEEFVGEFRFGAFEEVESGFLHGEVFERAFRILAVELERIDGRVGGRHVAIERPVTAFDCCLDAILSFAHIDTVVDAGAVSDDEGRAFIFFSFLEGFESLVAIGAECDGGDVNVAVSHGELAEVFLAARFAAGREFGDGATAGGLYYSSGHK